MYNSLGLPIKFNQGIVLTNTNYVLFMKELNLTIGLIS